MLRAGYDDLFLELEPVRRPGGAGPRRTQVARRPRHLPLLRQPRASATACSSRSSGPRCSATWPSTRPAPSGVERRRPDAVALLPGRVPHRDRRHAELPRHRPHHHRVRREPLGRARSSALHMLLSVTSSRPTLGLATVTVSTVTVASVQLSTPLMYAGNPRETADQVAALEKAGLDIVWVAEAYGFDSPTLMGYLAAKTETVEIGAGDPQRLLAHPGRAAADRGRPRQRLRRPGDPRPRRLRAAGDRGLPRRALRQAAGPHPRGHRDRPARPAPRAARVTTASSRSRSPRTRALGLGKPLKMLDHARARHRSRSGSPRSATRTSR